MSRRRAPTLATLADNAAAGRRVVASSGQLDGPFLAALQRLNLLKNVEDSLSAASTWGDGVHQDGENATHNLGLCDGKTIGKKD